MLDARCSIPDKDQWIFTDELFLFDAVQEEDIAAEAASERVGMIGYDIKKVGNEQGGALGTELEVMGHRLWVIGKRC